MVTEFKLLGLLGLFTDHSQMSSKKKLCGCCTLIVWEPQVSKQSQ